MENPVIVPLVLTDRVKGDTIADTTKPTTVTATVNVIT